MTKLHTLETALDELVALARALRASKDRSTIAVRLPRLAELTAIIRYEATVSREPAQPFSSPPQGQPFVCAVPGCTNGFPLYNGARTTSDPLKWYCLPHFPDDGRAFIIGHNGARK